MILPQNLKEKDKMSWETSEYYSGVKLDEDNMVNYGGIQSHPGDTINFKIEKSFISKDKKRIIFQNNTDNESLLVEATPDCDYCADSWFEHSEGAGALKSCNLIKIEELKTSLVMPCRTRKYVDRVYGIRFHLSNNSGLILEMRNSGDDTYGGSIMVYYFNEIIPTGDMIPFEEDI
jgi:hypothetical protein